ncbi:MAG TPA: GNAT family N-acetyltransferase [Propionibacteriaceae bacterium]
MDIRPFVPADLPAVLDLTLATFGPFYEDSYRPAVGEEVFHNRHSGWRDDYRTQLVGIHDPSCGKYAVVATSAGAIDGYVAWLVQADARHGEIDILAVAAPGRRQQCGRCLAQHAIDAMQADGVEVVSIGTGGDAFHAPARALYESLGFTAFPTVSYTKAL